MEGSLSDQLLAAADMTTTPPGSRTQQARPSPRDAAHRSLAALRKSSRRSNQRPQPDGMIATARRRPVAGQPAPGKRSKVRVRANMLRRQREDEEDEARAKAYRVHNADSDDDLDPRFTRDRPASTPSTRTPSRRHTRSKHAGENGGDSTQDKGKGKGKGGGSSGSRGNRTPIVPGASLAPRTRTRPLPLRQVSSQPSAAAAFYGKQASIPAKRLAVASRPNQRTPPVRRTYAKGGLRPSRPAPSPPAKKDAVVDLTADSDEDDGDEEVAASHGRRSSPVLASLDEVGSACPPAVVWAEVPDTRVPLPACSPSCSR